MALTKVSTDGVKDGSLVNADINANAAIAGTKVNPNFGTGQQVICGSVDSNGGILGASLQLDSSTVNYLYYTDSLQIAKSGHGTEATIDASGNLGLGSITSNRGSHSRTFTVSNTNSSARSAVEIEGNTANCHAALEFYNNGTLVSGLNSRGSDRLQFITGSSGTVRGQFTSNGLNFGSDTAADNALDDYEEGSWTPVLGTTGTAPTVSSYQNQIGKYTKIGNIVHLFMFLDISANNITDGGSGDGTITGLPFYIGGNSGDHNGAAMINFAQLPNSFSAGRNDIRFKFNAGETRMRIHQYSSDNPQVQTGLGAGQIANGNRFKIGLVATYRHTG